MLQSQSIYHHVILSVYIIHLTHLSHSLFCPPNAMTVLIADNTSSATPPASANAFRSFTAAVFVAC